MDWIKKNPAQFGLAIVSFGLLASAVYLYSGVNKFPETFTASQATPNPNKDVPDLKTEEIDEAAKSLSSTAPWKNDKGRGSLFVSDRFVLDGGTLKKPQGSYFNPPVANDWLDKYGLDATSSSVLDDDPDKDGFNTLLEWNGADGISHLSKENPGQPVVGKDGKALPDDATDPINPESKPPYATRLAIDRIVNIPFRLRCMSYDINPKNAKDITVQINTVDAGNRTLYIAVGEPIPNTHFKTESFQKKEAPANDGTTKDISELTIVNLRTSQKIVLPLGVVVDSPESYIVLKYLWVAVGGQPTPDMNLKKGDTFKLPPKTEEIYKVVDIKAPNSQNASGEVTIQLPSGGTLILTHK